MFTQIVKSGLRNEKLNKNIIYAVNEKQIFTYQGGCVERKFVCKKKRRNIECCNTNLCNKLSRIDDCKIAN